VLALADPSRTEAGILSVLLASLGPAVAWAGAARRARSEALEYSAARQVISGTLIEHTARGERARIARELHDVVAHHISMVAVQAETARLTTAGMPAAGGPAAVLDRGHRAGRADRDTAAARRTARGRPDRRRGARSMCSQRSRTADAPRNNVVAGIIGRSVLLKQFIREKAVPVNPWSSCQRERDERHALMSVFSQPTATLANRKASG